MREAALAWLDRRFGLRLASSQVAACIGTKEFVATLPQFLKLRRPDRDTVLHPAVSYPTYAIGAALAGCRPVAVPCDEAWRLDLSGIDPADAARALCLWVNTPSNPAGALEELEAVAEWGRGSGVPVFSDECYVEFTWNGRPRTILEHGDDGVVALHSLSKRSNAAGLRAGFYVGDPELVEYLGEVRRHAGMIVAAPTQAAATVALGDDEHVAAQRQRYQRRLGRLVAIFRGLGVAAAAPDGGLYLWAAAPGGDAWSFAERLARQGGALVTPGDTFGPDGAGYVRVAATVPDAALELLAQRLDA
jgi:aspartate/methionine/tyrosine aminotransferase